MAAKAAGLTFVPHLKPAMTAVTVNEKINEPTLPETEDNEDDVVQNKEKVTSKQDDEQKEQLPTEPHFNAGKRTENKTEQPEKTPTVRDTTSSTTY